MDLEEINRKFKIIKKLTELGKLDNLDDPSIAADFEQFRPYEYLGRIHWSEWYPVCTSLSVDDHIALLKAVVMAMRYAGWDGGSVAPCIWIYKKLEERVSYKVATEMASWVIDRSDNPWAPFGTQKARKLFVATKDNKSNDDYSGSLMWKLTLIESTQYAEREEVRREVEKEQQIAKAKRLEERKLEIEKHHKLKQNKEQHRRKIIEFGEQITPILRLQLIVDHNDMPLHSFPSTWAEVTVEALKELDGTLKKSLINRLAGQKKGPWKKLRDCLDTLL